MADITMPQLGETVTEGTITRWLKSVGDAVAEDELLFEVSTDKVDTEVGSPTAGFLTEILVPEGQTVDVGTRLAVVSSDSAAAVGSASPGSGDNGASVAAPAEVSAGTPSPAPGTAPAAPPAFDPAPAPVAVAAPPVAPVAVGETQNGSGDSDPGDSPGMAKVLSPVVRRLITDYNLDPGQIDGTGNGGRLTRGDVLAYIDRRASAPAAPAVAPSPIPTSAPAVPAASVGSAPTMAPAEPAPRAGERDTVVRFTNIRRRTAEHMVRSKQISAHTLVSIEVDYFGVDKARAAVREAFKAQEGFSLTYLPFISRALVDALAHWPNLNSSVGDDELIVHNYVNLGVAVDLNHEGLLVPVIHDADGKRLRPLAREISSLAAKARSKRLTMDDISGGTFTITNAGPYGTLITIPVINQPQVAILSTDGVRKRPVAIELPDGSDSIAVHPVGNLALSFDHRAVDGAYAAAFLANVRDVLETRDWLAEL